MKKNILGFIAIAMLFSSCAKDWLQTDPSGSGEIPTADATLEEVVNGMYYSMYYLGYPEQGYTGEVLYSYIEDVVGGTISLFAIPGAVFFSQEYMQSSEIIHNSNNSRSSIYWSQSYSMIAKINLAIILARTVDQDKFTVAQKDNYDSCMAELLTLRAYNYHRLNRVFSRAWETSGTNNSGVSGLSVPLMLTANANDFTPVARNTRAEVVAQIEKDLDDATALYTTIAGRPTNRNIAEVATAGPKVLEMLKARFYMYKHEYAKALVAAEKITPITPMSATEWASGFNTIGASWIFAGPYTGANVQGYASPWSVIACNFVNSRVSSSPFSIDISLFGEVGQNDTRLNSYIRDTPIAIAENMSNTQNTYYIDKMEIYHRSPAPGTPTKFRQWTSGTVNSDGDLLYMRAAEAHYIAAEAAVLTGDLVKGATLLNNITRIYDPAFNAATTHDELLEQIIVYKKFDMFMEGLSFEDAKRRGVNVIRDPSSHPALTNDTNEYGQDLLPTIFTFMVPLSAMNVNPMLVQNEY